MPRQHRRHRHPRWSRNREPSRSHPWFFDRSIARTSRCYLTSWPSSSHRTCTSSRSRRHCSSCPGRTGTSRQRSTCSRGSPRCTSRSPRKPAESRNRRTSQCHRDTTRTTTSRRRRYSTRRTGYPGTYTPSTPPPCSSSRLGTPRSTSIRQHQDPRQGSGRQHTSPCHTHSQSRCRYHQPTESRWQLSSDRACTPCTTMTRRLYWPTRRRCQPDTYTTSRLQTQRRCWSMCSGSHCTHLRSQSTGSRSTRLRKFRFRRFRTEPSSPSSTVLSGSPRTSTGC